MTPFARPRPVGRKYMELIRRFPLRAIRSEAEYDQAAAMIDKLAVVDEGTLTADEQDYLDALTLLISSYDDQHHRVDTSGLSPGQLIKFLMEQHGLSPADLEPVLGNKSAVSFILNGKRAPSRAQCFRLGDRFRVDPGAFL